MSPAQKSAILLVVVVAVAGPLALRPQQEAEHEHQHPPGAATDPQMEKGAVESMHPGHQHMSAHMKWTAARPANPEDQVRAEALTRTLREALEKYRDYRVAIGDGYQPFLPQIPQPEYHFTNYRNGFLEAFSFDPARPTSLLYRKTAEGYELAGAMFTMPRRADEEQLNARVPLSVTPWHLHVNLCMPPREQRARADWTKFGLQGSIATPEACAEAGGTFQPVIFGWMVHVYPFENSPEKIWRH